MTTLTFNLNRQVGSGLLESNPAVIPPATLIGSANFTDGNTTPASIFPGTSWLSGVNAGGAISVVGGQYKAAYPIPTGAVYTFLSFYPPANTTELYVEFQARFVNPHSVKFCKFHGQDLGGGNYANATFGLSAGGIMTQTSFGDGVPISNDTVNVINLGGGVQTGLGRNTGIATVLTPQNSSFSFGTALHTVKIRYKRNSGTTAVNEINDGIFYVEIDGLVYVNATNMFNRNYQNGPIDRLVFGDFAQDSDYAFDIYYDNIKISTGGFIP